MSPNERPSVEGAEPPEKIAKAVNPPMKALLSSPMHGPMHGRPLSLSAPTSRM